MPHALPDSEPGSGVIRTLPTLHTTRDSRFRVVGKESNVGATRGPTIKLGHYPASDELAREFVKCYCEPMSLMRGTPRAYAPFSEGAEHIPSGCRARWLISILRILDGEG